MSRRGLLIPALVLIPAALAGCAGAGPGGQGATGTTAGSPGALSADDLAEARSLSMNRACSAMAAMPGDCVAATDDKIALAVRLQPKLTGLPASDLATEAARLAGSIGEVGREWGRLSCPAMWSPDCAGPAAAVESDFAALATFLVQITAGGAQP